MLARTVQLQNHDGSLCRYICQAEADRMMVHGEIFLASKRKALKIVYRYHPIAEPSASKMDQTQLVKYDMDFLAGLNVEQVKNGRVSAFHESMIGEIQRLMGHNVVPFNENFANA